MSELWRDIPGYEGHYQASDQGRIKSLKHNKERILSQCVRFGGYLFVNLSFNKTYRGLGINRLVLQAFEGKRSKEFQASHLNGNNKDNRLSNLKWESPSENNCRKREHGTIVRGSKQCLSKLTEKDVMTIRQLLRGNKKQAEIAGLFNVNQTAISKINTGKTWKHLEEVK